MSSRLRAFGVAALAAVMLAVTSGSVSAAAVTRSLTELQVPLYGMTAGVEPASPIVPKQTASGLRVVLKAGGRTLSAGEVAHLLGGPFEIQAELSGPGLGGTLSLPRTGPDAIPSADPLILTFPGLPHAGEYEISNIRLVRGGRPVLDVEPRRVTLRVIEQILVTSVVTRPLTLDEIRERGVVLDASSYLGFEFAITLKLESTPVSFRFPVVFDRQGVPVPIPLQPPPEPLRSVVSAPQLVPVLLRPAAFENDPDGAPPDYSLESLPAYQAAKIPSLLVIPGSVGYLKQFFSAQLMVGNGAPGGSGLVVKDVTGTLRMPPGADGIVGTADDPLALPALESGPQSATVAVLGEGQAQELLPGEFGRGELTLRGEREGRHDVDFDIRAQLLGLPVGPVSLEGSAHGVVLVRNAYFDVTFTVPTVVRADEEFSVFATVSNVGQGTGNDVKMTLDGSRLSGARLLSAGTQTIASLTRGDAATLEYRFRAEVTGEVVASYLRFDTTGGVDVTGRLNFVLGVGERRVTQSPDTLVLPAAVRALPSDVVRAAMRVLGQAWSAATATSLPPGVERPSTEAVFRKGLSVAEAGLRVELGQPMPEALRDLLLDLHGVGLDPGFDQVLRETVAGRDLDRVLGAALGAAGANDALGYEEQAARVAASGAPFVSFAVVNEGGGALPAEPVLRDGSGGRTDIASRGVPGAVIASLGSAAGAPRLGWVAALGTPPYAIELEGQADGTVGLSLTLPSATGAARHAILSGIAVRAGSRHRVLYDPARTNGLVLETDLAGDGAYEGHSAVALSPLDSEGPRLVAASTIGPETLDGASPFGTYAALLFDRVVRDSDAALASNYEIASNSVLAARRQLSGRLVFVAFEQPEGPLVPARLAVDGIHDERGVAGGRQEQPLGSRLLLPGAVVSGSVREAGGDPVADALVTYLNTASGHGDGRWDCSVSSESGVAAQRTDAAGRFTFRYVPQNPCGGPFRLETTDLSTGAVRGVKSFVRVDGQRLSLDLVLIGHGKVTGQVRRATNAPAAGARVRVVSVTDSQIGVVTTADAQGFYSVEGMTVGAVTVTAVLGANLGRGAGRLDVAGGTTTVDVTLDGSVDITGVVRKLEDGVLTPVPGVDVVYYVSGVPLGLSVSDSQGQYRLLGVPAGPYRLDAGLNQRDKTSLNGDSVAGQKLVQNLVIEVKDYSNYGTVRGTVKRLDSSPMADAWVSDGIVAARADALGQYELLGVALSATPRSIQAVSPDGRRSGSTSVVLTVPGQVVTGADIQLSGIGAAAFQVLDAGGAPVSGASVGLQGSCLHPCGCRFSTTDAQGIARFSELSFGPVSARAVVQGVPGRWDSALGSAVVSSEEVAGGGVIRLAGFGSVTGVVTNPNSQPAHGASVELTGQRIVVGAGVCGLQTAVLGVVNTDTSGLFHFDDVHVGPVVARASSVAFPQTVARAGAIGAAGNTESLELRLVDTMAGVLSGTVRLPDGLLGAGPDVEVTASGSIPDVTVHTDEQGRYAFAQVLPAGGYLLTARDTRPGGTGSVVQARIWLQAAQPAQHDLRLKAKGPVRVTVVDGAGDVVANAVVHVKLVEAEFPYRSYEGTIDGAGDQPLEFASVFEGPFSITASDNFARGGRASGAVPPEGLPSEARVQLTTIGRVTGRFLWADHATPLPFATVALVAGGRVIGQQTTASEGDVGSYAFDYVPAGPLTLQAQDPRSGRTGVATGSLTSEGELLKLDVVAYAVGRVEGDVTLNGEPAPTAEVRLRSGQYQVRVTADAAGHYAVDGVPEGQVYATADLGGGFLAGSSQGALAGEGHTLQLPVSLRGAGTITGRLLAAGGSAPGAVSLVSLAASGRYYTTTTDSNGDFRFDLVPEGGVELVADALASIDCARESFDLGGGETVSPTLTLRGVGAAEGIARDAGGPLAGTLWLDGTGAGCATRRWVLSIGPSGSFRIPELVGGPVSASFTTRAPGGPWLRASASGVVSPGATTSLTLEVEPSGSVHGHVVHEDASNALGSQLRIDASEGRYAVVETGGDGSFLAEGIPAGPVTIRVSDPGRGGVALVTGLSVAAGSTLEAGVIQLLETPLAVVSVSPPDGTTDVAVTLPLAVTFNAPIAPLGGLSLRSDGRYLGFAGGLSTDERTVTLTSPGWPDSAEITIEAGPWVTDVYGRRLGAAYQSRFRTVDLSPPRVIDVVPANRAIQVDVGAGVSVRFDEPISTGGDLQSIVRLASVQGPVAGTVVASGADGLLFTPAAPLTQNLTYTLTVNGATDLLGHVQTTPWTSSFMTPDVDPPSLRLENPASGGWTKLARPTIRVSISDSLSGPDASRATMRLDGATVPLTRSSDQFSHVPVGELANGPHTLEASGHDRAGNRGDLLATFQVDTQPPAAAVVVSPTNDQVVNGSVTLAGTATDAGSGVARVNYLLDGYWLAEGPAASGLQAAWNTVAAGEGAHLLTAQAVDVAGNSGPAGAPVRVIVDNKPLAIAFTSPAQGFPVKTQVTVAAMPSEPVARVEFRAGSRPVVIDDAAPYQATFDVSAEPEGSLELEATAIGIASETATATRSILIDRTPPAAPDPTRVHAEATGSSTLLLGVPGAAEPGGLVRVVNTGTSASNERPSFGDGSFAMRIAADAGGTLAVTTTDVAGNVSDPLVLGVAVAPPEEPALPLDKLALWTRSGDGVSAETSGRVSRWEDRSGRGNDLVQGVFAQRPRQVPDPVSGRDVLHFDGANDTLRFTNRLDGTIRGVFAVLKQSTDASWRQFLGDATVDDFYPGATQLWWAWTSPSILNGQTWLDGVAVDGTATDRPQALSALSVLTTAGVTADRLFSGRSNYSWQGDIAELAIADQALTSVERKLIEDYLVRRYALYVPTVAAPVVSPDGGSFSGSTTVTLAAPTPGSLVRYTLDGSEPVESSLLYTAPLTLFHSANLRARAFRPGHIPSSPAVAGFVSDADFSPGRVPGLALWVRTDAGLAADAAGRVSEWRDQSGHGNHLLQTTLAQQPVYVRGQLNGLPVLRFDGTNDTLRFTTRLDGTIRAVFAVLRQSTDASWRQFLGDATADDFYPGATQLWWAWTSPSILNGQTWLNGVAVDGSTTNRPQAMSVLSVLTTAGVTADRLFSGLSNYPWIGDIAELVIYEQPLTNSQRTSVEHYLALKYGLEVGPVAPPEFSPNGGTFTDSVDVALASPTPQAEIRYTKDGSDPTDTSTLYAGPFTLTASASVHARAFHVGMSPSPVSVASFTKRVDFTPRRIPGLALWAVPDAGITADAADRVSRWEDQSGRDNHLLQTTVTQQPVYVRGQLNGLPVLRFDGTNDTLKFTTRLNGTIRAVFAVLKQNGQMSWRQFLGDATADDFYPGATQLWWAWTSPSILNGQTWLNGVAVDGSTTNRPQLMSVLSVLTTAGVTADRLFSGASNYPWIGDIAELVIYDQPLTNSQRTSVEQYLALKYALDVGPTAPPEFTPNGGTFTDSIDVALASPTPAAEIRYTTDGSEPSAASTLYGGPFTLTATTSVRARAFHAGMTPSPTALATFTKLGEFSPASVGGLALWVRGDAGVGMDAAGRVSRWDDLSGRGNHLVQGAPTLQPVYLRDQQGGLPALRFDGTNDTLQFTSRLNGTIRAVFAVLKQNGQMSWRQFLGDATADDFYPGPLTLWTSWTSPSILNGQTWLNGVAVDGTLTNRPQTVSVLSVLTTAGVTADRLFSGRSNYSWLGDIAELVIYDQPLTASQRKAVEDYLALKYSPYVGTVGAPEFTPNGGTFNDEVEVALASPTPGAEVRYTTDGSEPTASSTLYTSPFTLTATTLVEARAFRAGWTPSPIAIANFTQAADLSPAAVPGLVLWARADLAVATDGSGRVATWRDLSGRGNDLGQTSTAARPSLVPNVQAGLPVVRFDGSDDALLFKSRLTTIRSVFWVVREEASAPAGYRFLLGDASSYDFHSGAARQLWSGYSSASVLQGETRVNGVGVDGQSANRPAGLSVVSLVTTGNVTADAFSRDRSYGRSWWGDLAELVVYDRPLTGEERQAVEDYLALKYALYVPTLVPPVFSPSGSSSPTPVSVTLSAAAGSEIRYTSDASTPTQASSLYEGPLELTTRTTLKARAFRAGFNPSAVATATFLDTETPAPLRVAGLKLWVDAGAGLTLATSGVAAWADQSGNGNNLVQATAASQPQLVPAAANGRPALRFDGAGDFLSFTTRLTSIRSVFWVIRRSASATPGYRFLLGDPINYHFCPDATTKLWTATYASPVILNGETRLNGELVNGVTADRPVDLSLLSVVTTGDVTAATFSKDRTSDYSWWGDLAELVIFDRALSTSERKLIEGYLAAKYALFVPTLESPSISPAGGRLSGPQLVTLSTALSDATIRYTLDDSEPNETSAAYAGPFEIAGDTRVRAKAFLNGWNPSGESVVTFYGPGSFTPASLSGLSLWTRADAGVGADLAVWTDQSSTQNSLVQPTAMLRPSLAFDPASRMPLLRFDGAGDYMSFSIRLTKIRSVFWVIRRGELTTPGYRFLLGDPINYHFCPDGTTKLWTASYASPYVLGGQTRLNGAPVNGVTTDRPANLSVLSLVTTGDVSAATFSKDRTSDYSWWGDLAELVIYERALSPAEVHSVEAYLAGRYGIGLQQ